MGNRDKVAIDADFVISTTQLDQGEFFLSLMDELNVCPVFHQYVAEIELMNHEVVQNLIQQEKACVIRYDDFLLDKFDRDKYREDVWELYFIENEVDLPEEKYRDIYEPGFRLQMRHLGEIMTELMAREMQLTMFASNDKGAKRLAKRHISNDRYQLKVKNLYDILLEIGKRPNKIPWKVVKNNLNQTYFKDQKKKLFPLWNPTYQNPADKG